MKAKRWLDRISGLSTPIGGVSWTPGPDERAVAAEVLTYLEDRRVLFEDYELEVPAHCVESAIEIRGFLSEQLGALDRDSELAIHLRAMRGACREFVSRVPPSVSVASFQIGLFGLALGDMRSVVGVRAGLIAKAFDLELPATLERALPARPE